MQFEDPRSILESAAAKPSRGIDAPALLRQGTRLRRARLGAAATGVAVVVAAASASFGMLADGDRDRQPGPAAPSPEKACRASNDASFYLRDHVDAGEGRELAEMLDTQLRTLDALSRVEYVSKRQAYREIVRLYREDEPGFDLDVPWKDIPASLRLRNVDDATVERLEKMLAAQIETMRATAGESRRGPNCETAIDPPPTPDLGTTVDADPPTLRTDGQAVVKTLRAECRTGTPNGSVTFSDESKWCRFVLFVDNGASRALRLDLHDQVLKGANGVTATPWEDGMTGDFSTRLFTSPIPPGRQRMGQVIFLLSPGDVPAMLEIHPEPGFGPASFLLEYDCPADLHDEPGNRCLFSQGMEPQTLRQTWDRVEVTLYHCGVDPVEFGGREWVVPDPPFDATNAPESFTGRGLFKQRSAVDALYFDDSGEVIHFQALEDWEPPLCL
jgi:hypothetical protein